MKKYFFLTAFLFALAAQSQSVEIDKWKYLEVLQANPKIEQAYLLENGKPYTKSYLDSIQKTKDSHKFSQVFLLDSVQKKVTVVLKKRTDKEIRKTNEEFFDLQKKDKANRKKLVGSTLTDLSFTDMTGKKYTSGDLSGKMVVLNFWFTKCAPCIKEMPDLNRLKEKYGGENVVFFAVTYDKKDIVEKFLSKVQLDLTVVPDERKTIDAVKIGFYPTNMILDPNGKVLFVSELFYPKSNMGIDELEKMIKKNIKKS